jgi:hypothetical protein
LFGSPLCYRCPIAVGADIKALFADLAAFFGDVFSQHWQLTFFIPSEAKIPILECFFELFLPMMEFTRGQMLELNFMNLCYSLIFLTASLWSPFGSGFFICPQLGSLIASSSFVFVGMVSLS